MNMRTIIAGLSGGSALNISMLLTFRLMGFGWNGDGILVDSSIQSKKLVAVWTTTEPLPLIVQNPLPMVIGLFLFGIGHALVYKWISISWPNGIINRALRFAFFHDFYVLGIFHTV